MLSRQQQLPIGHLCLWKLGDVFIALRALHDVLDRLLRRNLPRVRMHQLLLERTSKLLHEGVERRVRQLQLPHPVPCVFLRLQRTPTMLTMGERPARLRVGAITLVVISLLACAALAGLSVRGTPAVAAGVAVGLAVWVGIASLFSP